MPDRVPTRYVLTCLLSLSLVACTAPATAPAPSEPFCRVGGLAFHSDFEAAALHACASGESGPVLTIAPEYAPVNPSPWYAWRITTGSELTDRPTRVAVTQRYLHAWHRYAPWTSLDGERWQLLPDAQVSARDDGSVTFQLDVPSGGLYVAAQPPLTSRAMSDWAAALAADHGLSPVPVAQSVQGRDITAYLSRITGQSAAIILISRQHPPEVTGGLAYQDFVERLLADDSLARRFREHFVIGLVPEVNPDGVVRGHWRTNARGVDLNRDWGAFTQPETRGLAEWLAGVDGEAPLRLFIDFHSTSRDVFYVPHASEDPLPLGFAAAWRTALQRRLGDDMPEWSGQHNPGLPTSKSWVQEQYGVFAMTYEVGDNTPRDRIRRIALAVAEETMRLLLETGDDS